VTVEIRWKRANSRITVKKYSHQLIYERHSNNGFAARLNTSDLADNRSACLYIPMKESKIILF
jgi:hypothetical protein